MLTKVSRKQAHAMLEAANVPMDDRGLTAHRDGTFTLKHSYFYSHGMTEDKLADMIRATDPRIVIDSATNRWNTYPRTSWFEVHFHFEEPATDQPTPKADEPEAAPPAETTAPTTDLRKAFNSEVIKIASGRWDRGAWHRAIDVARHLSYIGMWDGLEQISLFDPYALHNRIFGTQQEQASLTFVHGYDYQLASKTARKPAYIHHCCITNEASTPHDTIQHAYAVAQYLADAGLWDGESEITIRGACSLHRQLFMTGIPANQLAPDAYTIDQLPGTYPIVVCPVCDESFTYGEMEPGGMCPECSQQAAKLLAGYELPKLGDRVKVTRILNAPAQGIVTHVGANYFRIRLGNGMPSDHMAGDAWVLLPPAVRHIIGTVVDGQRSRFSRELDDLEFQALVTEFGGSLPPNFWAWHLEETETKENSARVKMLAELPIVYTWLGVFADPADEMREASQEWAALKPA